MLQGHKNSGVSISLCYITISDTVTMFTVISIDLSPTGGYLATGSGDWQARVCKSHLLIHFMSICLLIWTHRELFAYVITFIDTRCMIGANFVRYSGCSWCACVHACVYLAFAFMSCRNRDGSPNSRKLRPASYVTLDVTPRCYVPRLIRSVIRVRSHHSFARPFLM